jgi:hypothetical protein
METHEYRSPVTSHEQNNASFPKFILASNRIERIAIDLFCRIYKHLHMLYVSQAFDPRPVTSR